MSVRRGAREVAVCGLVGLALTMFACVEFEQGSEGSGASQGGEETAGTEESSGGTPTTGPGGGEAECDLWAQDCPSGSKCAPYDKDGDGIHDTPRCVPIGGSDQAGDDCMIEGSIASGLDTCDLGLICWNADAENKGRCVVMCSGSPQAPMCPEDLLCDISNGGALLLCVAACDPLTPSCPSGQLCLPGGDSQSYFICDTDASGDMGGYGDPCAFVNVCDPGLLCLGSSSVPGCKSGGCCSEYCDVSLPAKCSGEGQECLPYYGQEPPPPGYENVGVCSLPL